MVKDATDNSAVNRRSLANILRGRKLRAVRLAVDSERFRKNRKGDPEGRRNCSLRHGPQTRIRQGEALGRRIAMGTGEGGEGPDAFTKADGPVETERALKPLALERRKGRPHVSPKLD